VSAALLSRLRLSPLRAARLDGVAGAVIRGGLLLAAVYALLAVSGLAQFGAAP
jgi:hypothetical protein